MLFRKTTTACFLAIAIAFVCSTQSANATHTDSPLEGTWTVSEIVFHGRRTEKRVAGTQFVFAGNTLVIDTAAVENPLYGRQNISVSLSTEGDLNTIEIVKDDGQASYFV